MNRYQLAKIVDWAGTLETRKRMQKVVYLLQVAGCPLDVDYDLHYYGPYSQDVARITDEMVREKLLDETTRTHSFGQQYSYTLTNEAKRQIEEFERSSRGEAAAKQMASFQPQAHRLLSLDLWDLEVASTIAFFRENGHSWDEATERAKRFKSLTDDPSFLKHCQQIAHEILD